jgi:hypothetical protein
MLQSNEDESTNATAQFFARDEEDRQNRAKDEEELQMKAKGEEKHLQKPASGNTGTQTEMPDGVQGKMENAFGEDFSDVNIQKDSEKAQKAGALAYTQGNDVHFAPGQYNPGSQKGQELLGHELSHVVQQREGRVKPTNKQQSSYAKASEVNEGMPVNTDPALDKEADERGKQAAQEKMADVKGKGSGVQKQGGDNELLDITLHDGWNEVEISGVKWLGAIYNKYYLNNGEPKIYNIRNIIVPNNQEQWKTLLKFGEQGWNKYILGFLYASNNPDWYKRSEQEFVGMKNGQVANWTDYYYANEPRKIEDFEKLNFLEALFAVDEEKSELDLPQSYTAEAAVAAEKIFFPELATFLSKHQGMLVNKISSRDQNARLEEKGIKKLVEQTVPAGIFTSGDPEVAKSMIHSAYASTLSSAKFIIASALDNPRQINDGFKIVRNSALIIKNVIDIHTQVLDNIQSNRVDAFYTAWSLISVSNPIADTVIDFLTKPAEIAFKTVFKENSPFSDLKSKFKEGLWNVVDTALENVKEEKGNISNDKYLSLENALQNLVSAFESNL